MGSIACHKSKVYSLDSCRSLKVVDSSEIEISKLNNPKSEFWKI